MDDEQTCGGAVEHGKESRLKTVEPARVGCASGPIVLENIEQSPSGEPFFDDCYTTLLHNPPPGGELSVSKCSEKRSAACYTNDLHIVRTHLVRRGSSIYFRRRVPGALQAIVGKREIWRSLRVV